MAALPLGSPASSLALEKKEFPPALVLSHPRSRVCIPQTNPGPSSFKPNRHIRIIPILGPNPAQAAGNLGDTVLKQASV
jgi:hypothetical protein